MQFLDVEKVAVEGKNWILFEITAVSYFLYLQVYVLFLFFPQIMGNQALNRKLSFVGFSYANLLSFRISLNGYASL